MSGGGRQQYVDLIAAFYNGKAMSDSGQITDNSQKVFMHTLRN